MQKEYSFFVPPVFDGFDKLQGEYSSRLLDAAARTRAEYLKLKRTMPPDEAYAAAAKGAREKFEAAF
jgi:multiple sugar transport system substrate-binding protein